MTPYRRIYRAKFIAQSADLQRVDVRPYDASLPDMAGLELRHGIPGAKVQVAPGCTLQVGWDDGKPDRPFAALWSSDARALRVVLPADVSVELGTEGALEPAVKGTSYSVVLGSALTAIAAALTKLGKVEEAGVVTAAVGNLPTTLSAKVKIGG